MSGQEGEKKRVQCCFWYEFLVNDIVGKVVFQIMTLVFTVSITYYFFLYFRVKDCIWFRRYLVKVGLVSEEVF